MRRRASGRSLARVKEMEGKISSSDTKSPKAVFGICDENKNIIKRLHDGGEVVFGDVKCDALIPAKLENCLLYTSPSPRDRTRSRMPSSA